MPGRRSHAARLHSDRRMLRRLQRHHHQFPSRVLIHGAPRCCSNVTAERPRAFRRPWAELVWLSSDRLLVRYDAKARIYHRSDSVSSVGAPPSRGYYAPGMIGLALTLYRMGEVDEALAVLAKPVPKLAIAPWVEKVVRVRDWMLAQRDAPRGSPETTQA